VTGKGGSKSKGPTREIEKEPSSGRSLTHWMYLELTDVWFGRIRMRESYIMVSDASI